MSNSQKMNTSNGNDKISSVSSSGGQVLDEEYIDMELSHSPSSRFQCYSPMASSPPQSREFEFQMSSSVFKDKEAITSPADELFYKGKLLPLHLPPRLQMVQKLLLNATTNDQNSSQEQEPFDEKCGSVPSSTNSNNTPLESCNISPSQSCRVSCELNPDEYFFEWSTEMNSFVRNQQPKRSWTKKLKKSSLSQKLKASSAYIKSLFSKSGCTTDPSFVKAAPVSEEDLPNAVPSRGKEFFASKYSKVTSNGLFEKGDKKRQRPRKFNTLSKSIERDMADEGYLSQRRSFSGVIQWYSGSKSLSPSSISTSSSGSSSSSSSFSLSSNGFYDLHFLKRSGSASSELESSIEGAIAHCKMSQKLISARKTSPSELVRPGCSLSDSGIQDPEDQDRPKIANLQ